MASLTETALNFKKALKIGGLAIGSYLLIKFGAFIWSSYLRIAHPEPPPPPTVAFGKLPSIAFPEKIHPELTLRLETATGGTPDLGDRATVYLMPTFRSNLLALDEAKETAGKMMFRDEPKEITERRFRWENNQFLPSILEMDIIDGSFILKRNWQADPTILTEKQLPGKEQTVIEAKNFLRQANLMTDEMESTRVAISYLTFSAGQYIEAVSLSEADFVQADLFRPDIDDFPVLPADPEKGIINLIFSGSTESQKRIIQADYNYLPVEREQIATYPIKTASQAWRELQTRQGYIASVGDNPSEVIAIRKIYLGYYDGGVSQGFLLPVIVFEGDKGFFGYVEAISDQWLEEMTASGGY